MDGFSDWLNDRLIDKKCWIRPLWWYNDNDNNGGQDDNDENNDVWW